MNNWQNKQEVKKGNVAENIVHKYLEKMGYIVYYPISEGRHPFDRLVATENKIMIAEVKAKARRSFYPDTGINERCYKVYKNISEKHNLDVFIFFADEFMGTIYGNFLSKLEQPTIIEYKGKNIKYPLYQNNIIFFPLKQMLHVGRLNQEDIIKLKNLSNRNYEYPEENKKPRGDLNE